MGFGETLEGVGLHGGAPARVRFEPAPEGEGILFVRADLPGAPSVPATVGAVASADRATTLAANGVSVRTVEHALAALHGAGCWNARVVVEGPELPIGDGSALPFLLLARSLPRSSPPPLRPTRVIRLEAAGTTAEIEPASETTVEVEAAFDPPVGRGFARWDGSAERFEADVAPARTFALEPELHALRARGLASGAHAGCGVLFGSGGPIVGAPLRFPDEPVRHKLLDLVGDLALLGAPLLARVRLSRGGHALALRLLRRLSEPGVLERVTS